MSQDDPPPEAITDPLEPASDSLSGSVLAAGSVAAEPPAPVQTPPGPEGAHAPSEETSPARPSYLFFGVLASIALLADVSSKAWAEIVLRPRLYNPIVLVPGNLTLTLAYNKGGAWGLLQGAKDHVRTPFFMVVSVAAIVFIVSLYSKLSSEQRALKWGLPLVLGGALGNLSDRVIREGVVDFIDYRADWVEAMNRGIDFVVRRWNVTDHWPTFNVADICICTGVGLMAVDMILSRRGPERVGPGGPQATPG